MSLQTALERYERIAPLIGGVLVVIGLALGTLYTSEVAFLGDWVEAGANGLALIAPGIIFFTLTPAIGSLLRTGSTGRIAGLVVLTYLVTTTLAGIWSLAFSTAFFGLEFVGPSASLADAIGRIWSQLSVLMVHSNAVAAIFLSIVAGIFAGKSDTFYRPFKKVVDGIEKFGKYLTYIFPPLLFMVGAAIPTLIEGAVEDYFLVVLATALLAIPWMFAFAYIVHRNTGMSLRRFVREHVAYVYPFAFATVSSSATIPVNFERTGKALDVRREIREFIVPLGATINMDGTMISAVVITIVSAMAVGYQPTVLQLLFTIVPLVIVTVGVPGIPGGLAAVVAPILADMLPLPVGTTGAFVSTFLILAIGLGDQIRTGVNVTDDALICKLFDHHYGDRFGPAGTGLPVTLEEIEDEGRPEGAPVAAGTSEP